LIILNWEKYNPPSDRAKHPYWFRFHRDSCISAGLSGLNAEQCWVWIQILSEASRKNSKTIRVKLKRLAQLSQVDEMVALQAIEMLCKNDTIRESGEKTPRIGGVDLPHKQTDIHTYKQTNKQTKKSVAVKITAPPAVKHSLENFVLNLTPDARNKIQAIYPDEAFVRREVEKMKVWLGANSQKMPKSRPGWTRFVMGWLERGWERHRKTMPSNSGTFDWNNIFKEDEKSDQGSISRAD